MRAATDRPNVVLIVLDTARADAFEPYGAPAGATPVVADLARAGAAHAAWAPASWTVPSHASMLSGLLPRDAGLGQAPNRSPHSCRPAMEALRDRLLPEVLRRRGWATRGVSTNMWLADYSGFSTGFESFVSVKPPRNQRIHDRSVRARVAWALSSVRAREDDGAAEAGAVVRSWLAEGPRTPFFWFVNLLECHSPYLPPRPYNDLGPLDRLRAGEEARRHLNLGAIWRAALGGFDVPPPAIARMRHLYAQAVRSMDDWIERLLDDLDSRGVLDDTVVVVTSDHGENLGEAGLMGHAFSLDDRLLRVPLVVRGPVSLAAGGGPVSLVDLPALLGDALGVPDHPWARWSDGGIVVAQLDELVPAGDRRAKVATDSYGLGRAARRRITTPLTAATDGTRKVVRAGDADALFDLVADPMESAPLPVPHDDPTLRPLLAALDRASARAEPQVVDEVPPDDAETRALEDQLRLLGYL